MFGQNLSLLSDNPGTQWYFNPGSGATRTINNVTVQDSDASGSDATQKPINPANSTDGGNTVAWFGTANITATKSSSVLSDPTNNSSNPKRIPGAVIEYTIEVGNSGDASPDAGSVYVTGVIDANSLAFDVTTGVTFTDGTTSSALSIGTVTYSNDAAPGPYLYDYTPVPDGNGYDINITSVKVTTTGTFAYGGSPAPAFMLKYRTRIK